MMKKSILLCVGFFLIVAVLNVSGYQLRRIIYARCYEGVTMPNAVYMDCANEAGGGNCEVRKGSTHILRAIFRTNITSPSVDSYVVWQSGWLPIPLPNQVRDACNSSLSCPLQTDRPLVFAYDLPIDDFWIPGEFPVRWTLTDDDSGDEILCFRFRVQIV